MEQILGSIMYFFIGIIFCAIGYKIFDFILPFDLNKEIDEHNIAAGLAVAGIFVSIAIVISASIA
ncbi:MAG: DUF350 domain-containing protein [Clostridium sp.]|uniref:DUF350 domain-containing protein n=1 Tax=Clostridium sp. TaxID=1506 RepID=UPI003F35D2B6